MNAPSRARASGPSAAGREPDGVEPEGERLGADGSCGRGSRALQPRPRYGGTPWSGTQAPSGGAPVCQNTSIGMPPRGYQ